MAAERSENGRPAGIEASSRLPDPPGDLGAPGRLDHPTVRGRRPEGVSRWLACWAEARVQAYCRAWGFPAPLVPAPRPRPRR